MAARCQALAARASEPRTAPRSAVASRGEEFKAMGIESKNKTTSRKKPSGEKCCGGWCKCGQSAKMPGEGD